MGYCERTILSPCRSIASQSGIPKGGSLSPVLRALYLSSLDRAMEQWMKRGDCFYARFQDDIIVMAGKRHVLRRMQRDTYRILEHLKLGLRPEKTFIGRAHKGFDLLGYHMTCEGLSPNRLTRKKHLRLRGKVPVH